MVNSTYQRLQNQTDCSFPASTNEKTSNLQWWWSQNSRNKIGARHHPPQKGKSRIESGLKRVEAEIQRGTLNIREERGGEDRCREKWDVTCQIGRKKLERGIEGRRGRGDARGESRCAPSLHWTVPVLTDVGERSRLHPNALQCICSSFSWIPA